MIMKQQTSNEATAKRDRAVASFSIQLTDVRLRAIDAQLSEIGERGEGEKPRVCVGIEDHPDPKVFFATLQFDTRRTIGDDGMLTLAVTIEGAFRVIGDSNESDKETSSRFKEREILIALWPYLREQVQSITGRMRLPLPPLPVVDAGTLVGGIEQEDSDSP